MKQGFVFPTRATKIDSKKCTIQDNFDNTDNAIFSQVSASNFPSTTNLLLSPKALPTRSTQACTLLISFLSLTLRRGATRCVRLCAGYTLLKLSTKRLDTFSNNEKKTSGLSSCFDFLKICCSYAGHTLFLSDRTLPPHSGFTFSSCTSPNHSEPALAVATDDEGLSDDSRLG